MKLLVDECLSPELVKRAHGKGYGQSSHVVWMKRGGLKDWELREFIVDGDWTFVTKNSADFRGPPNNPGSKGQYAEVAVHAWSHLLERPTRHGLGHADRVVQ
jgi:hypothetical protein